MTAALTAPAGGLVSGQSALMRLAGSTPDALTVKAPVAMHLVYPDRPARPNIARLFEEPELKTFEERQKDKQKNQEKELRPAGATCSRRRKALRRAALDAADRRRRTRPDLALEALAPVARGELPVVMRADAEDDIRGAVSSRASTASS